MQLLIWRIQFTYHFCRLTRLSPFFCWPISGTYLETFDDNETPLEAVWSELSYWTD